MRVEIRRRADDGRALIGGHSHGDHVALDELTEVNARVEVPGDKIEAHFVGRRDVEHDVGVGLRKCAEFRRQHHRRRQGRHDETHASGRALPAFGNVVQHRTRRPPARDADGRATARRRPSVRRCEWCATGAAPQCVLQGRVRHDSALTATRRRASPHG